MRYRKTIILVIFFISILSLYYFLSSTSLFLKITGYFASTRTESDLLNAMDSLIKGEDAVFVDLNKNNTCFWIKSTMRRGEYIIEINEYENIGATKGCVGILNDTKYVEIDHPVNIQGIDCVCGDKIHLFEWESGNLKISRE